MNQVQSAPELPDFEDSLTSFRHYESFDRIPGAVFRRARAIIEVQRIQLDDACQRIAEVIWEDQAERGMILHQSIQELRERVTQRLLEVRPSQPGGRTDNIIRLIPPNVSPIKLRRID